MTIHTLVVGELQENCYVLVNEKKEAILIDPGDEKEKILDFLKPYKVVGILVTHFHPDHVGALKELENFYHLKANQKVEEFHYEVFSNPGHTLDSISFYFPEEKIMFVGDFIFYHTIGRCDLGGDVDLMKKSIQKILQTIPLDTILYPGHGRTTKLGQEKVFLEQFL